MEGPSPTPSSSSLQNIAPEGAWSASRITSPTRDGSFTSGLSTIMDMPVAAGASAFTLQRVIEESFRHAFEGTVVEYFEGMFKDLKDNQQMLHQKIECAMSMMRESQKAVNQRGISSCSSPLSFSTKMQPPCTYSDGWRKPKRGKNTSCRIRESLHRAQALQAHRLLEEPAESSQQVKDTQKINWPVAAHPCPSSNALNPQITEHGNMENKKHSEVNLNTAHDSADMPGCVNASYSSSDSVPSNMFDSQIEREVCKMQMSECAGGPEDASSERVQQEFPSNTENECEDSSLFVTVAPLAVSPDSSTRSCTVRSLACYRRQAAADIVSSIDSRVDVCAAPEPQSNSVGMPSKKLILHVVWTVFGILPWSPHRCAVVYRYVVISLAVCFSASPMA